MRQFTKSNQIATKQNAVDVFTHRWYDANGCGTMGLGGPVNFEEVNC